MSDLYKRTAEQLLRMETALRQANRARHDSALHALEVAHAEVLALMPSEVLRKAGVELYPSPRLELVEKVRDAVCASLGPGRRGGLENFAVIASALDALDRLTGSVRRWHSESKVGWSVLFDEWIACGRPATRYEFQQARRLRRRLRAAATEKGLR